MLRTAISAITCSYFAVVTAGFPAMRNALNRTGRPIVYSCQWPMYARYYGGKARLFRSISSADQSIDQPNQVYYFVPLPGGVRSIVTSMSLCLSVRSHNSKTTWPNFTKFCTCSLWPGLVLLWRCRDTLCTSGFPGDVFYIWFYGFATHAFLVVFMISDKPQMKLQCMCT